MPNTVTEFGLELVIANGANNAAAVTVDAIDASGNLLGSVNVATDANGYAAFGVTAGSPVIAAIRVRNNLLTTWDIDNITFNIPT